MLWYGGNVAAKKHKSIFRKVIAVIFKFLLPLLVGATGSMDK